jgi:tetratricopeptide (TPR) repeat protein
VLTLLTLLVYLPSLLNDFSEMDDPTYILNNPYIRAFDGKFLKWAFFDFYAGNWHPLTWISHALDYALWGLNPLGHHLTSIVLHAGNTALVVVLVLKLLELARGGTSPNPSSFLNDRTILITAGVTGLLFGIHPLHVESVAWVAERKDLLCAFFFLLSIMEYTKYVRTQGKETENRGQRTDNGQQKIRERQQRTIESYHDKAGQKHIFINRHYLVALGLFVLALMSKPMAVTLPVVLLILDWYPIQRIRSFRTLWAAMVEKFPFLVLSLTSSIATMIAQQTGGAMKMMAVIPPGTRILVAVRSLIGYLGKMLLPLNLIPFYPYPTDASLYSFEYASAILLSIGIMAACVAMMRKQKVWLSAWGYYIITLLPVLGLIQVGEQSMADRYTYLPSLGPFVVIGMAVAWIGARSRSSGREKRQSLSTTVVMISSIGLLLSWATIHQVALWRDDVKLWSSVIEREPTQVPFAYLLRGRAFEKEGQLDRAVADYTKAIALNPSFTAAYNNLGMIYAKARLYDQAIAVFSRSIFLDPAHTTSYSNRGRTYFSLGQYDKALEDLNKAIALNHQFDVAYFNRGELYYRTGRTELANADFRKACDLGNQFGCKALRKLMQGSGPE